MSFGLSGVHLVYFIFFCHVQAREKEERYLRRQQRRAGLEAKRKDRQEVKSNNAQVEMDKQNEITGS